MPIYHLNHLTIEINWFLLEYRVSNRSLQLFRIQYENSSQLFEFQRENKKTNKCQRSEIKLIWMNRNCFLHYSHSNETFLIYQWSKRMKSFVRLRFNEWNKKLNFNYEFYTDWVKLLQTKCIFRIEIDER